MSTRGPWRKIFGISESVEASWKALAASEAGSQSMTPLFWALAHGKLPEQEYYAWAQSFYELPLLATEYFAVPTDLIFWERVKALHAWKPDLIPLADWQGVLHIACVEPPAEFHFSAPHRFILANARQLKLLWTNLHPTAANVPDGFSADTLVGAKPSQLGSALPDGIVGEVAALPLVSEDSQFGIINDLHSQPDGLDSDIHPSKVDLNFKFTRPTAEVGDQTEEVPPIGKTSVEVTEIQPAIKEIPVVEKDELPENTMTHTYDLNWAPTIDPIPLSRCESIDDLIIHSLNAMTRQFTGAMVFLQTDDGLRSWKFTSPFRTPRKDFGAVQLDRPNIFRIVERTSLPYHGQSTSAPENDRFFGSFLGGLTPKHVTLVPILYQRVSIGMIMGIADSEIPFRSVLPIVERLSQEFAENYVRLSPASEAS